LRTRWFRFRAISESKTLTLTAQSAIALRTVLDGWFAPHSRAFADHCCQPGMTVSTKSSNTQKSEADHPIESIAVSSRMEGRRSHFLAIAAYLCPPNISGDAPIRGHDWRFTAAKS
jgi:hypothetical protein